MVNMILIVLDPTTISFEKFLNHLKKIFLMTLLNIIVWQFSTRPSKLFLSTSKMIFQKLVKSTALCNSVYSDFFRRSIIIV